MRTEKSRDYISFDMNFKQDFPLLFLELNLWHIERKFRSNLSICELRKVGPSHHHENVWISDKTRRYTVIWNGYFHLEIVLKCVLVIARTYLQLPLRQWGAGNVYLFGLSSWKVNIAKKPIVVMILLVVFSY